MNKLVKNCFDEIFFGQLGESKFFILPHYSVVKLEILSHQKNISSILLVSNLFDLSPHFLLHTTSCFHELFLNILNILFLNILEKFRQYNRFTLNKWFHRIFFEWELKYLWIYICTFNCICTLYLHMYLYL